MRERVRKLARGRFDLERFLELVRYFQAGIVNTLVGYLLFSALVALGTGIYLAQIGSTLIGTAFNYVTYSRHVFRRSGDKRRFVATYLLNYLLGLGALATGDRFFASPYVTGAVASVFVAAVNYFILKHLVFVRPTVS